MGVHPYPKFRQNFGYRVTQYFRVHNPGQEQCPHLLFVFAWPAMPCSSCRRRAGNATHVRAGVRGRPLPTDRHAPKLVVVVSCLVSPRETREGVARLGRRRRRVEVDPSEKEKTKNQGEKRAAEFSAEKEVAETPWPGGRAHLIALASGRLTRVALPAWRNW